MNSLMARHGKVDPSFLLDCYTFLLRYVSCFTWRIAGVVSCMERCDKLIRGIVCNESDDTALRIKFLMHCREYIRLSWFCTIHPSCLVLNFCVQNQLFPEYAVSFLREVDSRTVESLKFFHMCLLGLDFSNTESRLFVMRMIENVNKSTKEDRSCNMEAALLYMKMLIETHRILYHASFGDTSLKIHFPNEIRNKILSLVLSAYHGDIPFKAIAYARVLTSPWYYL